MNVREFELASVNGLPEVTLAVEARDFIPMPVLKMRTTTIKAFACIHLPDRIGEEIWNAVRDSAIFAGLGAAITGMSPGCVATLPVFIEIFNSCMAAKGFELVVHQVRLRTETVYSDWH
jgi:hypothetical protein